VQHDGKRNGRVPVPYEFVAFPSLYAEEFCAGKFEHGTLALLMTLYLRSDFHARATGGETPRLKLEALHKMSHWPGDLQSLAKQLRRLRESGYLSYRTEGQHRSGCVYVFRLSSDVRVMSV
jgi:hypothetical protein